MFQSVIAVTLLAAPVACQDDNKSEFVKIVHVETGKVLAVEDDSTDAGAHIVLTNNDQKNRARQWKIEKDGDTVKVTNRATGKVLDVNMASTDERAQIIQWDEKSDEADNQRWNWVGDGKEQRLRSKLSGHVLDIDSGKVVQKKSDEKAKWQLWRVVPVEK